MTISIRPLTEADLDAADVILESAYGPPAVRRHQDRLLRCMRLQPDGWVLALLDGAPTGLVGAVDYGPFAYVGLMAVDRSAHRRGVGMALMERLLAWLDARGVPVALLDATDMGAPLYARLGFVEDEKTLMFRRDACPAAARPAAHVRRLRAEDLADLADFDAPIFGAARRPVFESYLADDPARALIACDASGRINGYLFAQPQLVGPWAARAPDAAEALLLAALDLPYEAPTSAIVPASNAEAQRLLMRQGFSPQRTLSHMRRGGVRHPGRRTLIYGQSSFALG